MMSGEDIDAPERKTECACDEKKKKREKRKERPQWEHTRGGKKRWRVGNNTGRGGEKRTAVRK